MKMEFTNLKGTYDYPPEKQILRENIKSVLQSIFKKYGFSPLETPILCGYDLLSSKYSDGADILNETYKLSDQGKRNLGLRYDLTITFSKLISMNPYLTMPFKRYEIGKVFRDGPVKLGRNREFTQCDIDMVGVKSLLAEAEYMMMTYEAYNKLGIDIEILYNNRKILNGIIQEVFGKLEDYKNRQVIMLIDKFEKLTQNELLSEFKKIDINSNLVEELQSILNLQYSELKQKFEFTNNLTLREGLNEIDELIAYLDGTPALFNMRFAAFLARGIDVYTGIVWEIFPKEKKIGNNEFNISMGGGGRYDKIISSFINDGHEYPAVGMSFGLDVIYEYIMLKTPVQPVTVSQVLIVPINCEKNCLDLATKLREYDISVELEKKNNKVKKSMNFANKMRIPYVIVVGESELETNTISIKDMITGNSKIFSLNDISLLAEYINK